MPLYSGSCELPPTQLSDFIRFCERATQRCFAIYEDFERFSCEDYRTFWRCFLDWSQVIYSGNPNVVCVGDGCESAEFFPDLRLNVAENLLAARDPADDARPALTSCAPGRDPIRLTRGELQNRVARLATALQSLGVSQQWRIAMVAQSDHAAAVAALAAAALGVVVAAGSTELAVEANTARLIEFQPTLLFCHLHSPVDSIARQLRTQAAKLVAALPSLRVVIALDASEPPDGCHLPFYSLETLIANTQAAISWPRLPFNHPYTVLFTSGTTGPARGIVHSAGGTLLENLKVNRLHLDIRPGDKVFIQASTAWVIWRHQLSMLGAGAELILSSAPVSRPDSLWRIVAEQSVTYFGTTPAYLKLCQLHGYSPRQYFDFGSLRAIVTAGSIMDEGHQSWARTEVKALTVRSNYGSTDFWGSVLVCNPNRPDHPGQLQSRGLGIDARIVRQGESGLRQEVGELVIAKPFPSRPIGLLNDPARVRFHEEYFARNPGYWSQGDLAEFTPEGGARIHGRSDSVMNIRGIRIGPGEIYQVLRAMPEIEGALACAQSDPAIPGGDRLVLLVVLRVGMELGHALELQIRDLIQSRLSSVHVPEVVAQVPDLPMTHNHKLSERSAADAVSGRPVANRAWLKNPECLAVISDHPALRRMSRKEEGPRAASGAPNSAEAVVRAIWERTLGRQAIGRNENFFDLGGNSIKAMEVFAQLEGALGLSLPISILHQAATIAELADLIERHIPPAPTILVAIAAGSGSPPFFVVHGIGGHVMELRPALRALRYAGPIYALQARGVAAESAPLERVEDMAACYVAAIREVQPQGPYLLAGYSLGGLVALEMARILLSTGAEVREVMLLDTLMDHKHWPLSAWLKMLWNRLGAFVRECRRKRLRDIISFSASRASGLIIHLVQRYDTNMRRRFAELYAEELPPTLRAVKEAGIAAMANYTPRFLDHPIHFIKAADGLQRACDPVAIWSPYVRSITVSVIPGDHDSILLPPHRDALAKTLSQQLNRANHSVANPICECSRR